MDMAEEQVDPAGDDPGEEHLAEEEDDDEHSKSTDPARCLCWKSLQRKEQKLCHECTWSI